MIAVYPRIVVQDDLVQHASREPFGTRLKRDSDRVWFIDVFHHLRTIDADKTLKVIKGELGADELTTIPDIGEFTSIRSFIVTALEHTSDDFRKHTKYRWLANQFNEGVADYAPGALDPIQV
jgi:hypothetical protein